VGEGRVRIVNPKPHKFFGFGPVDVLGYTVMMSDGEKTAIDCIDRPALAGGVGEAASILAAASRRFDWPRAVDYLERIDSTALVRRFGWLIDHVKADVLADIRERLLRWAAQGPKTWMGPNPAAKVRGAVGYDETWHLFGWYGDSTSPLRILYLIDKNKAFFLDASAGVGFGFVEPQSAAPASGFSNASLSGNFLAATASVSVSPNPGGCGLASLDGSGNFIQIADLSSTSGLSVDQSTIEPIRLTNGRGTVTSLAVVSAGFGGPILGIFIAVTLLLSCRKMRRNTSRPGFATFCFTILLAATPASCPHFTNQLVFYEISPRKAVMFHESTFDKAPVITIIEN